MIFFLLNAKKRLLNGEINKVFEKRELFLKPIIYVITVFISNLFISNEILNFCQYGSADVINESILL